MKRISIVIATYCRPGFLIRTLSNLQKQTYRPLEVVIADDGSPPATRKAIGAWQGDARPGFKLLYLWQENQGPGVARDNGRRASSGELILFMDDDDLMHPDALSMLAEKSAPGQISCASYRYWVNNQAFNPAVSPVAASSQEAIHAMIAGRWFVPIHGYLFPREVLEQVGEWDSSLTSQEDDDYLLRSAMAGFDFAAAPDAEVYYCQHNGVRRATPGKPGETLHEGMAKRMYADLAIRQMAFDQLKAAQGETALYRLIPAFSAWRDRFLERYGDIIPSDNLGGSLPEWLARYDLELCAPSFHEAQSA